MSVFSIVTLRLSLLAVIVAEVAVVTPPSNRIEVVIKVMMVVMKVAVERVMVVVQMVVLVVVDVVILVKDYGGGIVARVSGQTGSSRCLQC